MTFSTAIAQLKCLLDPLSFEQFDFINMSGDRSEVNLETTSKQTKTTPVNGMGNSANSCVRSSSEDTDKNTNTNYVKHINRNDAQLDEITVLEVLDDQDKVIKRLEDEKKTLIAEKQNLQIENSTLKESSRQLTEKMASLSSSDPRFENTNDETSPSKIGKLSDSIFNKDWFKAYECLDKDGLGEKEILEKLSGIIEMCYKKCADRSTSAIRQFLLLSEFDEMPSYSKMVQVYKLRKSVSHEKSKRHVIINEISASIMQDLVNRHDDKDSTSSSQQEEKLQHFVSRCTELCWLAVTSSPPLNIVLDVSGKDHRDIQTQFVKYSAGVDVYCDTEKSLGKVAVVVWPAIILSEDNVVYNKGTVLLYDKIKSPI